MCRLKEDNYKVRHVIINGGIYEYYGQETDINKVVEDMAKNAEELAMHYTKLAKFFRTAEVVEFKKVEVAQ